MRSALFFGPWLLACGLGLWLLGSDASKSAPNASAPTTWPVSARVPKAPLQPSLVLFAHPYCACTRASLSELERILARAKDRPDVWVVLAKAKDGSTSSIANAARRIPGVHVIEDTDGSEAARFGVEASGQVLVYGRDGRLAFRGGITPARGHEGDSRGGDLALRALSGGVAPEPRASADVFGCGLAKKEP